MARNDTSRIRALQIRGYGTNPALEDVPFPIPEKGQVLVRIAACGLNFADLLIAKGTYQDLPPLPATLGLEAAGTIEALGEGVEGLVEGQRVAVNAGHGGLADYGAFDASVVVPIPDEMDFATAAGFTIAYGTSHMGLVRRARLRQGERLVVLGAAGGVGLTAVEIGAALGAEVIAVARGADKLDVARWAGAHRLVDAETVDLRAELKRMGGVDVVYDAVGGELSVAAMRACRPEGRVLLVGFAGGEVPHFPANHLLVKNVDVLGFYWGGYRAFAPEIVKADLTELFDLFREGKLSPHIGRTFPLSRATDALDHLASRKSTGKVVVTMDD